MSKDYSGPAFPVVTTSQNQATGETTVYQFEQGATLRDYFAAKAMQAALTGRLPEDESEIETAARYSYAMADAMLTAREA